MISNRIWERCRFGDASVLDPKSEVFTVFEQQVVPKTRMAPYVHVKRKKEKLQPP
jgi:hypothetical protein